MRGKALMRVLVAGLILGWAAATASAAVKLPALFSDNLVLQRDQPVPVWGWAQPEEEITVTVAGQSATAKAGKDGRWQAKLPKLSAGGPHEMFVKGSGGDAVTLKNVLVGEVWLCSGQSNMEWPVIASDNGKEEVASAKYPKIRLFNVQKKTAEEPQADCKGNWAECSPQSVPGFSAVGYFFIREIYRDLDVPVAMIGSSWGGTPAEAWTSRKALESEPSLKPMLDRFQKEVADYNPEAAKARYEKDLAAWKKAEAKAKADGKKFNAWRPQLQQDPRFSPNSPSTLYNGMIAPVVPYAIRGAIWYQGESNCSRAFQYRTLFPLMIRNWREVWGEGDFPFGVVQLAPYKYNQSGIGTTCAELREAQTITMQKVPNVGMAVTMDIGNVRDIHPKNKQEVGRRLALWALAKVYGKELVYSGPIYKSMTGEGSKIRIHFDHAAGGLKTRDGKAPSDFAIAGADQKFSPATATIEGDTVVVQNAEVAQPVAVRYGWQDDAEPNLANQAGLPASPFRTDTWKGVTDGNK
jgi:sialate O-acetylesterase